MTFDDSNDYDPDPPHIEPNARGKLRWPHKGEIEEAMDVLSRHPTPTDFVALALNLGKTLPFTLIRRCDFVLHMEDGRTIEVKGNNILP